MCETIPPLPQYAFMAWCLVKHRDNFTLGMIPGIAEISECEYEVRR